MQWQNITLKGALAFYLVTVAALMVFIWMIGIFALRSTVDAGMAALLASFVTMFIKMAADSSGYQYTASAGADKKDEASTAVTKVLADKVTANGGGGIPAAPVVVVSWLSLLTATESAAIEAAAPKDERVQAILASFKSGKAEPPDLADLVTKGLLTQERADAIKGA